MKQMCLCTRKFLLTVLFCLPACIAFGETTSVSEPTYKLDELSKSISGKTTIKDAGDSYLKAAQAVIDDSYFANVPDQDKKKLLKDVKEEIKEALKINNNGSTPPTGSGATNGAQDQSVETGDTRTEKEKAQELQEKQQAYDDAKAKEQSKENRLLTATSIAATGMGAMELAQGLAEQKADKEAEQDMAAYISTFRCKYGKDKSVKAGPEEIELPGANNTNMTQLRSEYFALAKDLKERKEALGMKPGIESEVILDKAEMGLYDDENAGITDGAYASLYRAQMLNSEKDQTQIDEAKKTSKNRVIGGAVATAGGIAIGVVGDSLINGKLGEMINKDKTALNELKLCLSTAGALQTDQLQFTNFDPSVLDLSYINCRYDLSGANGKIAQTLFVDSADKETICKKLIASFGTSATIKMITACAMYTTNQSGNYYVTNTPETYQTEYFDLSNYLSTNGLSFRAMELNNTCTILEENDTTSTPAMPVHQCAGLTSGIWEVKFNYGTVKGHAQCGDTINPNTAGQTCWCHADWFTNTNSVSYSIGRYTKSEKIGRSNSGCNDSCSNQCATKVHKEKEFRQSLFIKPEETTASAASRATARSTSTANNVIYLKDVDLNEEISLNYDSDHIRWKPANGENGTSMLKNFNVDNSADLKPGEWAVTFSYGTVKGTSMCSAKKGDRHTVITGTDDFTGANLKEERWGPNSKDWKTTESVLIAASGDKNHCWCQVTNFLPSQTNAIGQISNTDWVFYRSFNPKTNRFWSTEKENCTNQCASVCAGGVAIRTEYFHRALYAGE